VVEGKKMPSDGRRVWVDVTLLRGGQTVSFRGSVLSEAFEAIVSGGYVEPFVCLENVHWVESIWSEGDGSWVNRTTVYGRDKKFRWHKGNLYFRPEAIFSIAEIHDSSRLIGRPLNQAATAPDHGDSLEAEEG
jgi:hypothetical protein